MFHVDLTQLMAKSRDYEELTWAWQGWRDETGKKMKDMYEEFVALQNKAADLNGKHQHQIKFPLGDYETP